MSAARHCRLFEAAGMVLVLLAWWLNWLANDRWAEAYSAHDRLVRDLVQLQGHAQISANVGLDVALRGSSIQSRSSEDSSSLQTYQRTWASREARQAWLQRSHDDVFGLRLLETRIEQMNSKYRIVPHAWIDSLGGVLTPLEQRLQSVVGPGLQGWIATPSFRENVLTAEAAREIDQQLLSLSEQAFALSNQMSEALTRRRHLSSMIYTTLFFMGSALLILAKTLEWRAEVQRARGAR